MMTAKGAGTVKMFLDCVRYVNKNFIPSVCVCATGLISMSIAHDVISSRKPLDELEGSNFILQNYPILFPFVRMCDIDNDGDRDSVYVVSPTNREIVFRRTPEGVEFEGLAPGALTPLDVPSNMHLSYQQTSRGLSSILRLPSAERGERCYSYEAWKEGKEIHLLQLSEMLVD